VAESPALIFPSTVPQGSNTYNIFDSTAQGVGGLLDLIWASRFIVTIQNDQIGTLKAYWSADKGTTWNQYDTQNVTIPGAGLSSGPFDYLIDLYRDWKVDFVNGGTNQTTWRGNMAMVCGDRAKGT
jgi:hypothetical protein